MSLLTLRFGWLLLGRPVFRGLPDQDILRGRPGGGKCQILRYRMNLPP
jgi:hypothetical protein